MGLLVSELINVELQAAEPTENASKDIQLSKIDEKTKQDDTLDNCPKSKVQDNDQPITKGSLVFLNGVIDPQKLEGGLTDIKQTLEYRKKYLLEPPTKEICTNVSRNTTRYDFTMDFLLSVW